jgi:hypothetical protein
MAKTNRELKTRFPTSEPVIGQLMSEEERIHRRARALVRWVLGSFSVEELFENTQHSSGSSLGVSFNDTSIEAKSKLPITVTSRAKPWLTEYLLWDKELTHAIAIGNDITSKPTEWYKVVPGSRATTVDKTTEIRRFINVEATGNMFLQQGLMSMIVNRLKPFGLKLDCLPTEHRNRARWSSITAQEATIDWSSASDCNSIELLRFLLSDEWFDIVWDLRSDQAEIYGKAVPLHMISTMGNAVTFPLETLVFWAYAHAVRLSLTDPYALFPKWEDIKACSVFGDDCIVPSYMAKKYIAFMEGLGFIINDEKSFYGQEQFRESCGGDYLAGYDNRPFHLKAPTTTSRSALEPWLYIIGNSLICKYISYFGELSYMYDKELFRCLFGLFRRYKLRIKLVPSYFPDDAGLKIGFDLQRFYKHYDIELDAIDKSQHGTYSFRYCRFRYWKRSDRWPALRYAFWLKKPGCDPDKPLGPIDVAVRPDRKRGGYVVAKGISCHWQLPAISRASNLR